VTSSFDPHRRECIRSTHFESTIALEVAEIARRDPVLDLIERPSLLPGS